MNRSDKRYVLTDSGQRKHPDWVSDLEQQKQEYLASGGRVEEVPIGVTGMHYALSNKDRAAFCAHSSPMRQVQVEPRNGDGSDCVL